MRYLSVFLLAASLQSQTVLQLVPEVITACTPPLLGREHVVWNYPGAGPVQIRLGAADGIPMTSFKRPQNSADNGDWVRDGLIFVLVDATGQELARATAHVRCNPFPDPINAVLATSSYFPLQVGNEWAYSINSRIGTADHVIQRVTGVQLIGDEAWYSVVTGTGPAVFYRADAQGRIYTLDFSGRQVLYLDPTDQPDPAAALKVLFRGQRFSSAIGSF